MRPPDEHDETARRDPDRARGEAWTPPSQGDFPEPAHAGILRQVGVYDPNQHQSANDVLARGLDRGVLLGWIREYGPGILDIIKRVLDLHRGGSTSDPDIASPPAPPEP